MNKSDKKVYASNKVAYHDYFIRETLECGIVLAGNEVKSIRAGRVNLSKVVGVTFIAMSCLLRECL